MINNDERREVAERLRESREFISCLPKTTLEQNAFDTFELILACIGYEQGNLFDRLADLIDRPTCHDIASHGGMQPAGAIQWFECSECHCKAQTDKIGMTLHFCPHCGAEVE
mgnify:FL=1